MAREMAQFSVGSVEGVPFTACTSGPDIIILASNFARIQQITTSSPIVSLDCSTDVGKIVAAYDNKMVIFEPIPLVQQQQPPSQSPQQQQQCHQQHPTNQQQPQEQLPSNLRRASTTAKLDYKWIQTATIESETAISVMSFNLEGNRLIAGGSVLQLWTIEQSTKTNWQCVWRCKTACSTTYLKYSPDGTLFCSAGKSDRLVKIWSSTSVSNFNSFSFIYAVHPLPITWLEWRRTSKYTPRGAVANVLITSCTDNIARLWVQTLLPGLHFHLASVIEAKLEIDALSQSSFGAGKLQRADTSVSTDQVGEEDCSSQFVVHWINNKEIHITRSIELLLHDMLIRISRGNNPAASSTSSTHSSGESCSDSKNDTDNIDNPNDDTLTAESSKKLRHKLCRKMNKRRALAASGRRDPCDSDENSTHNNRAGPYISGSDIGRASPTSLVEEFDKTLESLLKKWQMSPDLLFTIDKSDGTLILWQVMYLDGEDSGIFRQVQVEKLSRLRCALPHYDATTMSLNVTAYSPSAYLDVKRAYLAVTSSSGNVSNCRATDNEQLSPVDVPEIISINTDPASKTKPGQVGSGESLTEMKINASASRITENEPSIFIVTEHLSGILGLWRFNFDSTYPRVQSVDLVTRITGLPIDPAWLCDGLLTVEYVESASVLLTKWYADDCGKRPISSITRYPLSPSQFESDHSNFDEIKSSLICDKLLVDEAAASNHKQEKETEKRLDILEVSCENVKDSYRASQIASSLRVLPQYHLKQLNELLAFGKLQRVKAILNHLVNCLVQLETGPDEDVPSPAQWANRSRTLSIVAQSAPSFNDSFDIDNPSSTVQQQVIEEIELDYVEVTSIPPLPLYSLIDADTEKVDTGTSKSPYEEFSTSYESIMRARSQVDETLDEILGRSTIDTLNKQKELKRQIEDTSGKGSLTSFNPRKAKLLRRVLTHTHLPGLSNIDQMHLLAVADAVALFDASPDELHSEDTYESSQDGVSVVTTNIAIDSLDDRGLRFLSAMRQHAYLTRCLPMKQRNELKASGIGNHSLVWAFHSESQDELISLIPCVQRNKPEWPELREFGVGWWLKKLEILRKLIEKVAQSAYQAKQDPLDAALFYLALKKKTLVCALLRRVNCDKRLLKLFEQDFNDPMNKKKALKNAYALLGLHRFEHAAAFFILAGSIWDAVEVCINNLNDIQLAMVLIRLHDNDQNVPSNLKRLLLTEILDTRRLTQPQDPFIRSMALWILGDYISSVHTLLDSNLSVSASVFNFYLFLKDQPLVVKQQSSMQQQVIEQSAIAEKERILFSATAQAYLDAGCPLLALEVLSNESHPSRAQRMKFIACLQTLMSELDTLASATTKKFRTQFQEWLQRSVAALTKICSYAGSSITTSQDSLGEVSMAADSDAQPVCCDLMWVKANEPILRAMLTYCNLHSATENSLTIVRLELLAILRRLSGQVSAR